MADLRHEELPRAILAWWYWIGCAEPLEESAPASLAWLRARWEAGDDHLPLTLVHDLGWLLLLGRDFAFASARRLAEWPEEERSARLRHEDRVLGRWAVDPSVVEAHVAIAGMPRGHRDAAVVHAIGLAIARPLRGREGSFGANPAHLRSLDLPVPASFEVLRERSAADWRAWALQDLLRCTDLLATGGRVFSPEDLWEIAHLASLPSDSARLALREIHQVAGQLGPIDPAVIRESKHRAQEVEVDGESSDHYPAGGFDALSTRGTFENLVRTEVAYVGEGTGEGGPDLFDVRYVEGELLYYTRDDSPLLDAKRSLTAVIHKPAELRHKPAALPHETLVLVEGLVLGIHADLLRVFSAAGGSLHVAWWAHTPEDVRAAEEERALFALSLAAELAHGRVTLEVVSTLDKVPERSRAVFSPEAPRPDTTHRWWIQVGGESWHVSPSNRAIHLRRSLSALRPLADTLLGLGAEAPAVVKKRRRR